MSISLGVNELNTEITKDKLKGSIKEIVKKKLIKECHELIFDREEDDKKGGSFWVWVKGSKGRGCWVCFDKNGVTTTTYMGRSPESLALQNIIVFELAKQYNGRVFDDNGYVEFNQQTKKWHYHEFEFNSDKDDWIETAETIADDYFGELPPLEEEISFPSVPEIKDVKIGGRVVQAIRPSKSMVRAVDEFFRKSTGLFKKTKDKNREKQKILDSILFYSTAVKKYLIKDKGYAIEESRGFGFERAFVIAFAHVARCLLKNDKEAIAFMEKLPLYDFALKMKNGKKCNVLHVWLLPLNIDLSNRNNVKRFIPLIERTPCLIPKIIKIESECFSIPIWDYYVFVGLSTTKDGGLYAVIMGYLSKKDLSSNKIATKKGEWKFIEGSVKTDLTVWEFKFSELRPFSEIENLITLEIVPAPELLSEKNNLSRRNQDNAKCL